MEAICLRKKEENHEQPILCQGQLVIRNSKLKM